MYSFWDFFLFKKNSSFKFYCVQEGQVSMKMEISSEFLDSLKTNFPLLEMKYGVLLIVLQLPNQEEHQIVWIRGALNNVYLAHMALMVYYIVYSMLLDLN